MKKYVKQMLIYFSIGLPALGSMETVVSSDSHPKKTSHFQAVTLDQLSIKSNLRKSGNNQFIYSIAFSSDSQFFALLEVNELDATHINNTITVVDTQTGLIKAQSRPFLAASSPMTKLSFSPDNSLLLMDGLVITPSVTWRFAQTDQVDFACSTFMGDFIETVDKSGQTYIVNTADSYYQLCKPGMEKALLQIHLDKPLINWWGEHTKILHNNKLLVIYNIRSESEPAHQGKAHKVLNSQMVIDPQWLDPWDLDYVSKAERFFTQHDPETEHFLLIESFPDQVMINLWDYGKKQWLDKQFFKGVQVSVVYAAGSYVLLQHESDFALITHQDDKLQLLWQRHFPALNVPKHEYSVSFSHDRQAIVFELTDKIIRVDTQTGEQTHFPRAVKSVEGELAALSPAFNYRVSHYFDPLRLTDCLEYDQNSSLYSVDGKEKLQTLAGTVFAITPDDKVVATCKGKELRLYRAVAAAK